MKIARVEKGVTNAVVWHLEDADGMIIFWNGPGSRLQIGWNTPGSKLDFIEHRSADDTYYSQKDADTAVRAFCTLRSNDEAS